MQIVLKDSQSQPEPRRRSRQRPDPEGQGRADADRRHARDRQPGQRRRASSTRCRASPRVVPWQPWFFGRKGDPAKGFNWTYHFFWGLEDVIANFTNGWKSVADQQAGRRPVPRTTATATPGATRSSASQAARGAWATRSPTRAASRTARRTSRAQIAAFKKANVEIVTGVVIPPDAKTFLTQARQQGFKPKVDHARQGAAVPGRDRGARRSGRRPDDRGLVEPVAPVHVVARRSRAPKALADGLRGRRRRSSGRSRSASRTRCSRSPPTRSSAARARRAKDVRDAVAATNLAAPSSAR